MKHSSIVFNDKIYVIGGINDERILNDISSYDIHSDKWSLESTLNFERYNHFSTIFSNTIYIYGGFNSIGQLLKDEIYNTEQNYCLFVPIEIRPEGIKRSIE
jgi:N-acetylneuraminic acid mutarotase